MKLISRDNERIHMPLPKFVTPEQYLKRMIEGQLEMTSLIATGKPMQELVDQIFNAVFNKATKASVQQVLLDIGKEE